MPGKSGFGESLARVRNLTGFSNLKHIVLVTDSDKNARDYLGGRRPRKKREGSRATRASSFLSGSYSTTQKGRR